MSNSLQNTVQSVLESANNRFSTLNSRKQVILGITGILIVLTSILNWSVLDVVSQFEAGISMVVLVCIMGVYSYTSVSSQEWSDTNPDYQPWITMVNLCVRYLFILGVGLTASSVLSIPRISIIPITYEFVVLPVLVGLTLFVLLFEELAVASWVSSIVYYVVLLSVVAAWVSVGSVGVIIGVFLVVKSLFLALINYHYTYESPDVGRVYHSHRNTIGASNFFDIGVFAVIIGILFIEWMSTVSGFGSVDAGRLVLVLLAIITLSQVMGVKSVLGSEKAGSGPEPRSVVWLTVFEVCAYVVSIVIVYFMLTTMWVIPVLFIPPVVMMAYIGAWRVRNGSWFVSRYDNLYPAATEGWVNNDIGDIRRMTSVPEVRKSLLRLNEFLSENDCEYRVGYENGLEMTPDTKAMMLVGELSYEESKGLVYSIDQMPLYEIESSLSSENRDTFYDLVDELRGRAESDKRNKEMNEETAQFY